MDEAEQPQQLEQQFAGSYHAIADKSIQEWRNDFTQEIKELRVTLTHKRVVNGVEKSVLPGKGLLCTNHFNMLLPLVRMTTSKGWTLSRVHEEAAEAYVVAVCDQMDDLLMSNSWDCPKCGCQGSRVDIDTVLISLEQFLYGNSQRSVGGYETEKLSTMQQITSHEQTLKNNTSSGLLGGLFGGRKWR